MATWSANRQPSIGHQPFIHPTQYTARQPAEYQARQPTPYAYQQPVQSPYIANARQPGTYARQGRNPLTY